MRNVYLASCAHNVIHLFSHLKLHLPVKFVYLQQVFQPDMAVDWDNSCSTFLEFWIDTLYKRCQCLGYISQKCDLISRGFLYHSCVVNVDFFHEILVAFADRYADQLGRLVPWPGIWTCNNASACLISVCRQLHPEIYEGAEWQVSHDAT